MNKMPEITALPAAKTITITAETEVNIPGYYLAVGVDRNTWLIRDAKTHKAVRILKVKW